MGKSDMRGGEKDGELHPNVLVGMKWWHWAGRDAMSKPSWNRALPPKGRHRAPSAGKQAQCGVFTAQTHLSPQEQPQNPHLSFTTSGTCSLQQQ